VFSKWAQLTWGEWCRWNVGHRRSSTGHSFVKRHSITWYIVDVFVGFFSRNYVFLVSGVLDVGTTSRGENGAVGTVDTVGVPLRIHL